MIVELLLSVAQIAQGENCYVTTSQTLMNQCASADLTVADAQLNKQWLVTSRIAKAADAALPASDKRPRHYQTLLNGQRAWLRFRDAQCALEGFAARGGMMEFGLVSSCKEMLTSQRTRQLRDMAASLGE